MINERPAGGAATARSGAAGSSTQQSSEAAAAAAAAEDGEALATRQGLALLAVSNIAGRADNHLYLHQ